jgi:hypothetical protein
MASRHMDSPGRSETIIAAGIGRAFAMGFNSRRVQALRVRPRSTSVHSTLPHLYVPAGRDQVSWLHVNIRPCNAGRRPARQRFMVTCPTMHTCARKSGQADKVARVKGLYALPSVTVAPMYLRANGLACETQGSHTLLAGRGYFTDGLDPS